ncbi:MAG: hypothetical protein V2J24_06670 [Pseudomonadales bacterium]|jgi:hypothetical protein|nr:hypothetical protein [Pseudomonadales bacterium]
MIPNSCIAIRTDRFPILAGEDEEIINEGTYGMALCKYLAARLPETGVTVHGFNPEDWGWWVSVEADGFTMGLCVYSDPEAEGDPVRYAILPSEDTAKKWSWARLRRVDVSGPVLRIMDAVADVFARDEEIDAVSRHDDFPF